MNESSTKFLDLPDEMIAAILDKLDLIDFFKSRLISKRFEFIIDNHECFNFKIKSFYLSKYISNNEISSFPKLILNFKILCCHVHFTNQFDLEFINQFNKLEFLKLTIKLIEENYLIKLPSLKKLKINHAEFRSKMEQWGFDGDNEARRFKHITFECKNLKKLKINQKSSIFKFKYPESVIVLKCNCNNQNFISQFKNIQLMKLYDNRLIDRIQVETLMKLDKLEEIYFYPTNSLIPLYFYIDKILRFKKSNKIKLKFYLYNIEMIKPFEDYNFQKDYYFNQRSFEAPITYQLLNYKLLSDDHFIYRTINYSELIDCLSNNRNLFENIEMNKLIPELPANFFQKFKKLNHVTIKGIKVDNKFICFLKHCYCILSLNIMECDLDQTSLDQLSIFFNSLSKLVLSELKKLDDKKINFDFIGQLEHLNCLKINQCDNLNNEISNFEFISKLTCVKDLKIFLNLKDRKKFDPNYLLDLKNIENLNTNLEFSDAKLSKFTSPNWLKMNQLSKFTSLNWLKINQCDNQDNEISNLELIDAKLIMNLFKNCKKLYLFKFYYLGKFAIIKRFFDNIKNPISIMAFNYRLYNEESSDKNFILNSNHDELYNIRYFNEKLSRYGFNYDQLGEYIGEIPNLLRIELKKGNKYEYTKNYDPGLITIIGDGPCHLNDLF